MVILISKSCLRHAVHVTEDASTCNHHPLIVFENMIIPVIDTHVFSPCESAICGAYGFTGDISGSA